MIYRIIKYNDKSGNISWEYTSTPFMIYRRPVNATKIEFGRECYKNITFEGGLIPVNMKKFTELVEYNWDKMKIGVWYSLDYAPLKKMKNIRINNKEYDFAYMRSDEMEYESWIAKESDEMFYHENSFHGISKDNLYANIKEATK